MTAAHPAPADTVLIVDDEPDLCELLGITLARMQVPSRAVHDLATARTALLEGDYALCLTDMRLPDGNGLDLVEWMQEHAPRVPVAMITAHGNVESAVRALKVGAFDFVSKPLNLGDLRKLVAQALKLSGRMGTVSGTEAGGATAGAPAPPPPALVADSPPGTADARPQRGLLGDSAPMQALRAMVSRVARSQAPVHIAGESGSGKELVARLIHESGPRRDGPFIAVNCGAIPSELMESELFGHKRGAFTGAVADKKGLVQAAEGGTLFLDEVADLPLHMQVKLLRVIQERVVRPVGESAEVPVDVRILSATHQDLATRVADGRFREDLYYRINVIDVRVPPLRERREDIPLLADHILARLALRQGITVPHLSVGAQALLAAHLFPGNVRELENLLERALTLCDGAELLAEDIQLRATPGAAPAAAAAPAAVASTALPTAPETALPGQLEEVERDAIRHALEQARWNKTAAAKALGLSFRQLRYRIKKLGIE
jgi:two-component system, NtrC family, response regulator PilR